MPIDPIEVFDKIQTWLLEKIVDQKEENPMSIEWEAIKKAAAEGKAIRDKNMEIARQETAQREREIQQLVDDALAGIARKVKVAVASNVPTIAVFSYNTSSKPSEEVHREAAARVAVLLHEARVGITNGGGEYGAYGAGYELYASVVDLIKIADDKAGWPKR